MTRSDDWSELSDMGQAYGGISAILSGLAFCGIAISLVLQWRQVRIGHIMTMRAQHFELVKLTIEDPDLTFPDVPGVSTRERRRWMVMNMWVGHWSMLWETSAITRPALKAKFDQLFEDDMAMAWWAEWGPGWRDDGNSGRRASAFLAVADEAHRSALVSRFAKSRDGRPSDGPEASAESGHGNWRTTPDPHELAETANGQMSAQPQVHDLRDQE